MKVCNRNERYHKYQGCVATDEMVHCLGQAQLAYWGEHPKCITSQKDDILCMGSNTRYLSIGYVLNRICCTSVLCKIKSSKLLFSMNPKFLVSTCAVLKSISTRVHLQDSAFLFFVFASFNIPYLITFILLYLPVTDLSEKSTSRVCSSKTTFSSTANRGR